MASASTVRVPQPEAGSLEPLLAALEQAPAAERILHREPILAFGPSCVTPLAQLAARRPDLGASIASWLEVLAGRDPVARAVVLKTLGAIAKRPEGDIAKAAVARLKLNVAR